MKTPSRAALTHTTHAAVGGAVAAPDRRSDAVVFVLTRVLAKADA